MSGNAITTTAHKTAKVEHSNISPGRKPASFFLVFFAINSKYRLLAQSIESLLTRWLSCALQFDSIRARFIYDFLWFLVGSSFLELRTT